MDQYIQLKKLDEVCCCALQNIKVTQRRWKYYHDSRLKLKLFKPEDLVLLSDSWFQKNSGKLKMWWLNPFRVLEIFSNGSIRLATLDGDALPTCINGDRLTIYYT
jgi:hypothetical protein